MSAPSMEEIEAAERAIAELLPPAALQPPTHYLGEVSPSCAFCQDWRTNVTAGREHPCRFCRFEKWQRWRIAHSPLPGETVLWRDGKAQVIHGAEPCDDLASCPKVCILTANGERLWIPVIATEDTLEPPTPTGSGAAQRPRDPAAAALSPTGPGGTAPPPVPVSALAR